MRFMLPILISALPLLSTAKASEVLELKGIVPGVTTKADIENLPKAERIRLNCPRSLSTAQGHESCIASGIDTFANQKVEFTHISILDGVVISLSMTVSQSGAGLAAIALTQKFGEPLVEDVTKKNGYGTEFTGKEYKWSDQDVVLTVETLGRKRDEGSISISNEKLQTELFIRASGISTATDDL